VVFIYFLILKKYIKGCPPQYKCLYFSLILTETANLTNVSCSKLPYAALWGKKNVHPQSGCLKRFSWDVQLKLQLQKQRGGDRERSNIPYEYFMRPVPDLHKVVQICFIVWRPLEMWSLKNGDNKCCCTSNSGFGTGNSVTLQLNKLSGSNVVNATCQNSVHQDRKTERVEVWDRTTCIARGFDLYRPSNPTIFNLK